MFVCRTRSIQRIDGLIRFEELYEPWMNSLQTIKLNADGSWNYDASRSAASLFAACAEFEFIMALVTVKNCLAYTRAATVKLQRENMDIVKGYQEIDAIKKDLMLLRQNLEFKQKEWFLDAVSLADFFGSKPQIKRLCGRQQNRSNLPANHPEEFYRRTITIPFLDHLICELNARFSNESNTLAKGFFIVPNIMMGNSNNQKWREEFLKFVERYKHDLPLPTTINAELDRWFSKWSNVAIEICRTKYLKFSW